MVMEVHLATSQGNIVKTATIESNDPDKPQQVLKLEGFVKAIVMMKPSENVVFGGSAGPHSEAVVDLEATTTPFHITRINTNLVGSISYSLQTVSQGTRYRLKIYNKVNKGSYNGFIRLKTDLPRVPYLLVRVMGIIKGPIAATPQTLIVGKLSAGKPVRSASLTVTSRNDKPFRITALTYNKALLSVSRKKLPNRNGFVLTVQPRLEAVSTGSVKQVHMTVETSAGPGATARVLVIIFNSSR